MKLSGVAVGDRLLQQNDMHPDWVTGYGHLGSYRFVGASAAGVRHVAQGKLREDAFAIRTAGPWIAVAVSDGVGSRKLSRYGASYCVDALTVHLLRTAEELSNEAINQTQPDGLPETPSEPISMPAAEPCPFVCSELSGTTAVGDSEMAESGKDYKVPNQGVTYGTLSWVRDSKCADLPRSRRTISEKVEKFKEAFQRTHRGVIDFARSLENSPDELACTLMALLVNSQTHELMLAHIGDGMVMGFGGDGAIKEWETQVTDGAGYTYSFTQPDWEKYLSVHWNLPEEIDGLEFICLMTDGVVEEFAGPDSENIFRLWRDYIRGRLQSTLDDAEAARRLLDFVRAYHDRSNGDDKTLVIVMRPPVQFEEKARSLDADQVTEKLDEEEYA